MKRRHFLGLAGLAGVAVATPALGVERRILPQPTGALVTRWDTDPWSLGSYSALPPGTAPSQRAILANTIIGQRVFLAGEYASTQHPATTTGAYLSGRYAAGRLMERTNARRVIIVGAGMAGAAAAATLIASGIDVTVIEARDRVGGRIASNTSWGTPVELGAAWIHGVRANPITTLAERQNLGLVPTNYNSYSVRDTLTGRESVAAEARQTTLGRLVTHLEDTQPPVKTSTSSWLRARGWTDNRVDNWAAQVEITQEYGLDTSALGVRAFSEGADQLGGDVLVSGGYSAIPSALLKGSRLILNAPVASVAVSGKTVRITMESGGSMAADAVIVAVPLALLQTNRPGLVGMPAATRTAMNSIRTGNLEKVILRYNEQWWGSYQAYGIVGGRWTEMYSLTKVLGFPALVAFCGGTAATSRPRNDAACVREATNVFQAAFG